MKLFRKSSDTQVAGQIPQMVQVLRQHINSSPIPAGHTSLAISTESITEADFMSLDGTASALEASLESIASEFGLNKSVETMPTEAQKQAAVYAGIYGANYKAFVGSDIKIATESRADVGIMSNNNITDGFSKRAFGLEAYNENENRDAAIFSIVYNMQSTRQDEFGEMFFPTITTPADDVGFGVTVNLMMVYDGIERKINGTRADWNRKNILRAVADASILKKDQTKVIPVHRTDANDASKDSTGMFVSSSLVAAADIVVEGETIKTAPLAIGKKIDLIGISQTEALLKTGVMDQTDSIEPAANLTNLYIKFKSGSDTDVLKFNISNLPYSNFVYTPQSNYREMDVRFYSTSVLINKNTKQADGSALVALAAVNTSDLIVRLDISVTGRLNIETGDLEVNAGSVKTYTVQDNAGTVQSLASGTGASLKTIIESADSGVFGYDILAYRSNQNRRQRGQLIDVQKYTQLYNVPLRAPITTIHPINTDGQTDASDVQALITATRIRVSNEAVTALQNAATQLKEFVDVRDVTSETPDVLGVGRYFVRPVYFEETVNMQTALDSLTSKDRVEDIQAVLVNKIRDYAYNMYRQSEYKAAADALTGGISPVPTVLVGTDPVIANYLMVTGDLRTLGNGFDYRIVSTLDTRVKGKVYITFGATNDASRNTNINPLNFGNMLWSPELVLSAQISRSGTVSKETVVQPRYLFITNLPVMTVLTVNNMAAVLDKVTIKTAGTTTVSGTVTNTVAAGA